jgi:hypothetical protein
VTAVRHEDTPANLDFSDVWADAQRSRTAFIRSVVWAGVFVSVIPNMSTAQRPRKFHSRKQVLKLFARQLMYHDRPNFPRSPVSANSSAIDMLKEIAVFCGVGLLASLALALGLALGLANSQINPQPWDVINWI